MNNFKTAHLFCIGAGIGLLIAGVLVRLGKVASVAPDKWLVPLIVGIIFLAIEFAIQRKPR